MSSDTELINTNDLNSNDWIKKDDYKPEFAKRAALLNGLSVLGFTFSLFFGFFAFVHSIEFVLTLKNLAKTNPNFDFLNDWL